MEYTTTSFAYIVANMNNANIELQHYSDAAVLTARWNQPHTVDRRTPLGSCHIKPAPIHPPGNSTCTHHSQQPNLLLAPSTLTVCCSTGSSAISVSGIPLPTPHQ